MARTDGKFINGIYDAGKRRFFSHEFQTEILEFIDRNGFSYETKNLACHIFAITPKELGRTLAARRHRAEVPARIAQAQKERSLRERLQERAVAAVEDSMDTLDRAIEKTEILNQELGCRDCEGTGKYGEDKDCLKCGGSGRVSGIALLPTAVNHLKNRGLIATKVLEGIGDFRRAGDDVPRDAPRQPLFNLPPGSHVAISVDISSQGGLNDGSGGREAEGREITVGAEGVATSVQDVEPSGGDRQDSGLQP